MLAASVSDAIWLFSATYDATKRTPKSPSAFSIEMSLTVCCHRAVFPDACCLDMRCLNLSPAFNHDEASPAHQPYMTTPIIALTELLLHV